MNPRIPRACLLAALLAAACLALPGCSSTRSEVESGPVQAKTFRFVDPPAAPRSTTVEKRAVVHGMIQEAITRSLAERGLSRSAGEADVLVAYMVVVGNNTTTVRYDDHFGYGRDAADLQQKAHRAYTSTGNPDYFEAGTLLVDLIDAKTFKLLWRRHVNRPVLRDPSEDARRERIQEAVAELFEDLEIRR